MKKTFLTIFLNLSVLLTINPYDTWAYPEQFLDVQRSIFIIRTLQSQGTGFLVEEDTLVTNLHVYYDAIKRGGLKSLSTENINSEKFYIEGVRGINLPGDLILLKIKDYEGPSLDIESPTEARLSESKSHHQLFLVGFPHGRFQIIPLTKDKSYTSSITQEFFKKSMRKHTGASGSPIVNEKGKVVAVYKASSLSKDYGTRKETLQDLLNKTRHQEIVSDNETIHDWIQQERRNLRILAQTGDVAAQFQMGEMLFYNIFTQLTIHHKTFLERTRQSEFWWKQAAHQDHVKAQYWLGRIFLDKGNITQAIIWLKKSALQNYVEAQYWMGKVLCNEGDIEQAKIWLKRAAERGHTVAQYKLGAIFSNERHLEQAILWLTQAAENGHLAAPSKLGQIFLAKEDLEQAILWLTQAAENGYLDAQYRLGQTFFDEGDMDQAIIWLTQAADRGHLIAQYKLGRIFLDNEDLEQAIIWLTQAAENGYVEAQYWLGKVLFNNGNGDAQKAEIWWKRAAKSDHTEAQYWLGVILSNEKDMGTRPSHNLVETRR